MKRTHRYRVTHLSRLDFGPNSEPVEPLANLRIIDDGSAWAANSPNLKLSISEGELAVGDIVKFTLEKETI